MKEAGFSEIPLGEHGPHAFKLCEQWNQKWDAYRRGGEVNMTQAPDDNLSPEKADALTIYPKGSIGAGFMEFRTTDAWQKDKKPATHEEWFRVWKYIKPIFGDVDPKTISVHDIEGLRREILETKGLREAHRTIKIWRSLWRALVALKYCAENADPSKVFRNTAPKGRSETWAEGEAVRLAKCAWKMEYYGLSAVIAVCWDTQLNPGDVRALTASQMASAGAGELFFTARGKTGVPVGGMLSKRSMALMAAYINKLGVELLGDAKIFRNRSGQPYSKDTLGHNFATVRAAEFGEDEKRTLGHDFRRSGAVEAIAGDASAENLSRAMGNTLSSSNTLFATYVPVNAQAITDVAAARKRGRKLL